MIYIIFIIIIIALCFKCLVSSYNYIGVGARKDSAQLRNIYYGLIMALLLFLSSLKLCAKLSVLSYICIGVGILCKEGERCCTAPDFRKLIYLPFRV